MVGEAHAFGGHAIEIGRLQSRLTPTFVLPEDADVPITHVVHKNEQHIGLVQRLTRLARVI